MWQSKNVCAEDVLTDDGSPFCIKEKKRKDYAGRRDSKEAHG